MFHPLQSWRSAADHTHLLVSSHCFPQGSSPLAEVAYLSLVPKDAHSDTPPDS
jgi:hypothetical protein